MPLMTERKVQLVHVIRRAGWIVFVLGAIYGSNVYAEDTSDNGLTTTTRAAIHANALDDVTVRQNRDARIKMLNNIIHRDLLMCMRFCSLNRLINDFQCCQHNQLPVAPPGAGDPFYARQNTLRVFDPTGFPERVLSGLIPETYRDMAVVFRITVGEDPVTRERVIFNANGIEIWRQAPPTNYDPWSYLRTIQPWALTLNTSIALNWRDIYDPSRILCEYLLMPADSVSDYVLACATRSIEQMAEQEQTAPAGGHATMSNGMKMSMSSVTTPTITGITVDTNSVQIDISLPDGFSGPLGLFTCTNLLDTGLGINVGATNDASVGFSWIIAVDDAPCRFFKLIYTLDPDADTDGDGIPDGWEIAHGLNPLNASDANVDPDGDGRSNLEEYQAGSDPHVADTGDNSTLIRFYYNADDRVTGASSGVPAGSALYTVLPDGNHGATTERSAQ